MSVGIKCTCSVCGIEFITHKGYARTICNKCSTRGSDTKEAICKTCGKTFLLYRNPNDENNFEKKTQCPDCRNANVCRDCGTFIRTEEEKRRRVCNSCYSKREHRTINYKGMFTKVVDGHYYSKCSRCKCEIEVNPNNKNTTPDGKFRKLCDKCHNEFMQEKLKIQCKECGKYFEVGRSNIDGGFLRKDYCPDCYYNKFIHKPEYIIKICQCCGKEFKVYQNSDGKFTKNRKYCDNCVYDNHITKERHQETCIFKYGVNWSCLTEQCQDARRNQQGLYSKVNQKFANLLDNNNIKYEVEYLVEQHGFRRHYDFYLPYFDCLIEINPTYTHNIYGSIFNGYPGQNDKKYREKMRWEHLNRTQDVDKKVIHIWDWDSWYKIINIFKNKQKLYARECTINIIENKEEIKEFLELNHIQGNCRNKTISLGLYYNEQLVQTMVFGRPRYNKNYEWELLRLCSRSDYIIVGGAERLFKHFIKNYDPQSVISYCDISKFTGSVYDKLGFNLIKTTYPSKNWSKGTNRITDNLLRQRGFDQLIGSKLNPPEIHGKGTDNEQLMLEHGWLPIYDCGQKVFEYRNSNSITKEF